MHTAVCLLSTVIPLNLEGMKVYWIDNWPLAYDHFSNNFTAASKKELYHLRLQVSLVGSWTNFSLAHKLTQIWLDNKLVSQAYWSVSSSLSSSSSLNSYEISLGS